jgi:hypothetical protein
METLFMLPFPWPLRKFHTCSSAIQKTLKVKTEFKKIHRGQNDHIVGMCTGYYCELNCDFIFWNRVGGMFTYCELNCEFIIWELHGTLPILIVADLNFP